MSGVAQGPQTAQQSSSQGSQGTKNAVDWAALVPSFIPAEDAMSERDVSARWNLLYKAIKGKVGSEDERRAVRIAVYAYAVKNGTSREGNYAATIVTGNGTEFPASIIPHAVGRTRIRQFFRGCMNESYEALKESRVIESDPRYVAKCAMFGINAECAFATADWLADCPRFTSLELRAHNAYQNYSLVRAAGARSGKNLEAVEASRVNEGLKASASATDSGHVMQNEF